MECYESEGINLSYVHFGIKMAIIISIRKFLEEASIIPFTKLLPRKTFCNIFSTFAVTIGVNSIGNHKKESKRQ